MTRLKTVSFRAGVHTGVGIPFVFAIRSIKLRRVNDPPFLIE